MRRSKFSEQQIAFILRQAEEGTQSWSWSLRQRDKCRLCPKAGGPPNGAKKE